MARRKETFIVKLWIDSDGGGTGTQRSGCRGSVEHLATRRRLYFSEVVELVEFLSRFTQPGEDGSS
jgi:hypothetical protein